MKTKKTETPEPKSDIPERHIIREMTHIIKCTEYSDGKNIMERTNDGFNAFELLGVLAFSQHEITEQIKGRIKPDIIKRTVIK